MNDIDMFTMSPKYLWISTKPSCVYKNTEDKLQTMIQKKCSKQNLESKTVFTFSAENDKRKG